MAMWYKLTSTVRRQKRDSKSLYYFFFRPRGRFVFQSKISGKFFEIHILYVLFDRCRVPSAADTGCCALEIGKCQPQYKI